jgi:iron complex outermembrane receptor protein
MKRMVFLFSVILCCSPVFPQFVLTGKVTDVNHVPLSGASVFIENTFQGTHTDEDGRFTLSRIHQQKVIVRVSFVGYETAKQEMMLPAGEEVCFVLSPQPVLAEEVIVKGIRVGDESPVTHTTLTAREVGRVNLGKDLPALLVAAPSITTTSDAGNDVGYSNFQIRGTDMTRINVTINGIPLNDAESHDVFWVDLPDFAASVNAIQIQRGVGTSTNGAAAFGASVNIQTQTLQPDPYGIIDNSFGSFHTFRHCLQAGTGIINQHITADIRLSKISSDGYIDRASSDLKSFFVSAGYHAKNTLLKLNIFSGNEVTYQAWEGVPRSMLDSARTYNPAGMYRDDGGKVQFYDNQTDNYQQDHNQLLFSQKIGNDLNLNIGGYFTRGKGYYESYVTDQKLSNYGEELFLADTGVTRSDLVRQKWLDNKAGGATFSLCYDHGDKLKLTFGGAWSHYSGDHFGYITWGREVVVKDREKTYYFNDGWKEDMNIYSKVELQLFSKLLLFGDLQYRHIDQAFHGTHDNLLPVDNKISFNFLNPKFGISYSPAEKHRIYSTFGIAGREPTRRDYIDADPGKEPSREILYDYELGYGYRSDRSTLGVDLYYMNYDQQLVLTGKINNVGEPIKVNVPHSYRAGLEILAETAISARLQWNMALTLSRNKILHFTEYVDDWDNGGQISRYLGTTDLSFSPWVIFNNTLRYEPIQNVQLALVSKYVSKQFIDNTSSEERSLDPYLIHQLYLSYTLHSPFCKELSITLAVNNILNEKYETNAWLYRYLYEGKENTMDGYFPQAGRHFLAGFSLKF